MPSTTTRAIAVGNRIRLSATEAAYCAELERIVGLAAPHLAPGRPNLICLTEMLGLPVALTGGRAALARRAPTSTLALGLLAAAYQAEVRAARRRWPGISLARALLLARADALYRPFARTLSRLAHRHHAHIVATTLAPRLAGALSLADNTPGQVEAAGPEIYNAALVFGPDGSLLGRVDKVYLTHGEIASLDLTAGALEDVRVIPTEAGRLGVAISLDAFTPDYLRRLDSLGAQIVVQPDANDQPWAAPSALCDWQPREWQDSTLGSIQPRYPHLRYNICAMQTGAFFEVVFDGQSSVTSRDAAPPSGPAGRYIGVDEWRDSHTGEWFSGGFLGLAPWVTPDPVVREPWLTLAQRRARLATTGRALRPEDYRESVIWADLDLEG
ncbi:MAG TPA: nitrilase-related carbon-nitrogen hydrolase [Ktedonobacterales bacterium]